MDDQNVVRRKTRVIDYNKTLRIQRKRDHVVDQDEALLKNLESSLNEIYAHLGSSTNPENEEVASLHTAAGFAIQYDKTAGILRAEDLYLKAAGAVSLALMLTTSDKYKSSLEKLQNLVLQRIRRIQSIKDAPLPKDFTPPPEDTTSEDSSLRKWAKFYVKVAPDIKHKHHTIHEFVDNNGDLFIEKDAQEIIDKKLLSYLPSFRNLDTQQNVNKKGTVSSKISQHYSTIRSKYSKTVRGLSEHQRGTIRVLKKEIAEKQAKHEPAFSIWFQKQESGFQSSEYTLSIYETMLKLVLLPISTQIPADLKTSSPMLDALRNAFHVDVPSHEKILVKLQKVLNKDNSFAMISKELETRLTLLDRHPFYAEDAFQNKDAFESWRQKEEEDIRHLMNNLGISGLDTDRTTHATKNRTTVALVFGKDSTQPVDEPPPLDYHNGYILLLTLIIKYESTRPTNHRHTVLVKETDSESPTQIAPLTPNWLWLLEQYGQRFSVGKLYRKIVYLDILAQSFEHSLNHLTFLDGAVNEVLDYVKHKDTIITKTELSLISITLDILYGHIQNRLTNYKDCYPTSAKEKGDSQSIRSLKLTLKILKNVIELDIHLRLKPSPGLNAQSLCTKIVEQCIQKGATIEYHAMILRAEKLLSTSHNTSITGPVNGYIIMLLCDMIDDELFEVMPLYTDAFANYTNFPDLITIHYYSQLQESTQEFCQKLSNDQVPDSLFELITKLKDFTTVCTKITPTLQPMPLSFFAPSIIVWINITAQKLLEWTQEACKLDKEKGWPEIDEGCKYSSSVVDLFAACYQPLHILKDFWDLQEENSFAEIFGLVIHQIMVIYVEILYTSDTEDFSNDHKNLFGKFMEIVGTTNAVKKGLPERTRKSSLIKQNIQKLINSKDKLTKSPTDSSRPKNAPTIATTISPQMCILVNNLEMARIKLVDLDEELDGVLGETISGTFKFLKSSTVKLIGVMLYRMNLIIVPLFEKIVDIKLYPNQRTLDLKNSAAMKELMAYLDAQLEVLAEHLYPSIFVLTLKELWETIMNDLVEILLPSKLEKYLNVNQALLLEEAFEEIKELFHASGVGLPYSVLGKGTGLFIRTVIGIFELTSEELIGLYPTMPASDPIVDRKNITLSKEHVVHLLAGRKDKDAQKFVKSLYKSETKVS